MNYRVKRHTERREFMYKEAVTSHIDTRTVIGVYTTIGKSCIVGNPDSAECVILGSRTIVSDNCSLCGCVQVGDYAYLGVGVIIRDGAFIGNRVTVGDNTELDPYVTIAPGCEIGKQVHIGSYTTVGRLRFNLMDSCVCDVKVGHNCWVGVGCTLSSGVVLGDNVWVHDNTYISACTKIPNNKNVYRLTNVELSKLFSKDTYILTPSWIRNILNIFRTGKDAT